MKTMPFFDFYHFPNGIDCLYYNIIGVICKVEQRYLNLEKVMREAVLPFLTTASLHAILIAFKNYENLRISHHEGDV
jgi:hypothetical protein